MKAKKQQQREKASGACEHPKPTLERCYTQSAFIKNAVIVCVENRYNMRNSSELHGRVKRVGIFFDGSTSRAPSAISISGRPLRKTRKGLSEY